jgi:hypothetical protein
VRSQPASQNGLEVRRGACHEDFNRTYMPSSLMSLCSLFPRLIIGRIPTCDGTSDGFFQEEVHEAGERSIRVSSCS